MVKLGPARHVPLVEEIASRASAVTRCLERAWAALRQGDARIPEAVVLLLDGGRGGRRPKLGHFARHRWTRPSESEPHAHEVAVLPDLLAHPADMLAVLVHEAGHAIAHEERRVEMGRNGDYLNTVFREVCQSLGLDVTFVSCRHGFAGTTWPPAGVPFKFHSALEILKNGLPPGPGTPVSLRPVHRPLPPRGRVSLRCGCAETIHPRRRIFVSHTTLHQGEILCGICGQAFSTTGVSTSVRKVPVGLRARRAARAPAR